MPYIMTDRFRRAAWTAVLVLVISAGTALYAQSDPNIFVNITSNQDKAADGKFGKDYHEHLRDMLENAMFNGIKKAYPCIHYLDQSAAEKMVGVERMRELLGGKGESRLQTIGEAIGASHLGSANVTVMGGTVVIGGSLMDSSSARAVGRAQVTVPAGNDNAILNAMTQFAAKLVASTGNDGPKCSGWQGEVSGSSSIDQQGKNPNGDPFSIVTKLQITCQIGKGNDFPPCQVSYSYKMEGKESSIATTGGGAARCNASASIYKGVAKVRVGPCQLEVTSSISVAGVSASEKKQLSLGGWEHEFPVAPNSRNLSGSKPVDKNTTLKWNLTYR